MTKEELKLKLKQEAEEKYNERLKQNGINVEYRNGTYVDGYLDSAEPREKRIEDLEKENAELKSRNQELLESCEGATMMYKDLQKAKEIIRMVIDSYNHKERFSFEKDLTKAEQFLSES